MLRAGASFFRNRRNSFASLSILAAVPFLALGAEGPGCAPPQTVGTNTCLACHDGRTASDKTEFLAGLHSEFSCETCHGPGSLHVQNVGRGSRFIDNPRRLPFPENNALCAECHAEQASGFANSVHAISELACFECHDVHREGAMTFSSPANMRIDHEGYRQTCAECHAREVEDYALSGHAGLPETTCAACHDMHVPTQFSASPLDNTMCLQCHQSRSLGFTSDAVVDAHTGGFHPVDPAGTGASRCTACHLPPVDATSPFGIHDHTLATVAPRVINDALTANANVIPASSCSGIAGCHDGVNPDGMVHDVFDTEQNGALQGIYEMIGDIPVGMGN